MGVAEKMKTVFACALLLVVAVSAKPFFEGGDVAMAKNWIMNFTLTTNNEDFGDVGKLVDPNIGFDNPVGSTHGTGNTAFQGSISTMLNRFANFSGMALSPIFNVNSTSMDGNYASFLWNLNGVNAADCVVNWPVQVAVKFNNAWMPESWESIWDVNGVNEQFKTTTCPENRR